MKPPVIVVLTCIRKYGISYLEETLSRIDAEGGSSLSRMVALDGDRNAAERLQNSLSKNGLSDWLLIQLGVLGSSTLAMQGALRKAAESDRDVLFFEDDILLCRNAVARMLETRVPDALGMLSFFDLKEVSSGSCPGIYVRPAPDLTGWNLWGCQALRLQAEMVRWVASHNWLDTPIGPEFMASDLVLGKLLLQHPTRNRYGVHIPCLVEHVGAMSACIPGQPLARYRLASNFIGTQFDALSLPRFEVLNYP